MVRGEGEGIRAPSHPLQALLGASQTAFCASPGQVAGLVPRGLMVSIDNTSSPLSAPFLKSRINKLEDYRRTGKGAKNMPKLLRARGPQDKAEEQNVRNLANSRHAPGDWIMRARMIARSWDGRGTKPIAEELGCHPQTVRERIHRFNDEGLDGLGDRPSAGRKRRITETERSLIIWLVGTDPPGRLLRGAGGELAQPPSLGREPRSAVRPKRTRVVNLYVEEPKNATSICLDELGSVSPRTYPPAPGWSSDGHRIKAALEYSRGPEKVWVYGALRVRDGKALTLSAPSRNTKGYMRLLEAVAQAKPTGDLYLITDNLSSHKSPPIREWLENHPRVEQVFTPVRACWLNVQEAWWRLFRREALAGQSFADAGEIESATRIATKQLNHRARPWVWGRPPRSPRHRRRSFVYHL